MMNREIVECDRCKKEFKMEEVKVQEEALTNDRTGMFFQCPHCEAHYRFASITKKGKRLQNQLKRMVTKIQKTPTKEEQKLKNLVAKHEKLLKEYSPEVKGQYTEAEVIKHD